MDLAAINIQRGRDHGLPPYVQWRKPCGLSPIDSFDDLNRVMSPETAEKFSSIYASVEDIDLYSAGLAEKPVRGGIVGPTFACIIAQQFSNLRKSDRFWYENGDLENSFTPAQLQQIRRVTFAEVICDTMLEVKTLQPFVFMAPDEFSNQRENCEKLTSFDITPWREVGSNDVKRFRGGVKNGNRRSRKYDEVPDMIKDEQPTGFAQNFGQSMKNFWSTLKQLLKVGNKPDSENEREEIDEKFVSNQINSQTNEELKSSKIKKRSTDDYQKHVPFIEILPNLAPLEILSRTNDDTDDIPHLTDDTNTNFDDRTYDRHLKTQTTKRLTDQTTDSNKNRNRSTPSPHGRNSKRKRQNNRRKNKPKRNSTLTVGHNKNKVRVKQRPLSSTAPSEKYYDQTYTVDNIPEPPTYKPRPTRPITVVTTSRPLANDEINIIVPAQRPQDLTYLINTVTKKPNKPNDYNIHIQINYYLNSTNKVKPEQEDEFLDNPNNPYGDSDFVDQTGYGSRPTKRPYPDETGYSRPSTTRRPYSSTKRPTTYYSTYSTTKRPYYSSTSTYFSSTTRKPYYSSTKNYFTSTKRPYSTTKRPERPYYTIDRPYYTTSKPYLVTNSNPFSVYYSSTTKRPNVIIIEDSETGFNRPYRPYDDYEAKRPVVGHIMKLDHRPEPEHSLELPHKIYYLDDKPLTNLDDKLDFRPYMPNYPDRNYVQVMTNHRPYESETKYVKISSVRGHTTSSKHFEPVFVSVQQKEGDDDLELSYSDIFEFFAKPENGTKVAEDRKER